MPSQLPEPKWMAMLLGTTWHEAFLLQAPVRLPQLSAPVLLPARAAICPSPSRAVGSEARHPMESLACQDAVLALVRVANGPQIGYC